MASVYNLNPLTSTASTNFVPLIIFNGESNSSGLAPNSALTAAQLAVRTAVQILNNTTLVFESLQIGVNNTIGHSGLDSTTHGWENMLATFVEQGVFSPFSQVYLVKTGQGGSGVASWNVGGAYFNLFVSRLQAAQSAILDSGKTPLPFIWYSLGINDNPATGQPAIDWQNATIAHFKNMRNVVGYCPIIQPQFMSQYSNINGYLSAIQATEKFYFLPSSTGANVITNSSNHWDSLGMDLLSSRMADLTLNTIGINNDKYTKAALLSLNGVLPSIRVTTLLQAPYITVQPLNALVNQGSAASFSVTAIANPSPSYQWQKQESGLGSFSNVAGAVSSTYTTGALDITNDNTDVYRVVASNSRGSATSDGAVVSMTNEVTWISLVSATDGIPSAGYLKSTGFTTPCGGRIGNVLNAGSAFAFVVDIENSDSEAIIVAINSTVETNYGWDASNVFISGIFASASSLSRTTQGQSTTSIGALSSYPCKIKGEKSGNNLVYSVSYNAGSTYTVINTHSGVLTGLSSVYLKAFVASPSPTKKIKVSLL